MFELPVEPVPQLLNPRARSAETKKLRTQSKLTAAAKTVIKQRGVTLRVEDVAKEAGVSIATLYNFYPNKGFMFAEVYGELIAKPLQEKVRQFITTREQPPPDARELMVTELVKLITDNAALVSGMLIDRLERKPQFKTCGRTDDGTIEALTMYLMLSNSSRGTNPEFREQVGQLIFGNLTRAELAYREVVVSLLDEAIFVPGLPTLESVLPKLDALREQSAQLGWGTNSEG